MDSEVNIEKKKNPREGVSLLSSLTFAWVLKIFWKGYKRDLEVGDLFRPLNEHKSSLLGDKLAEAWDKEIQNYEKTNSKKVPSLRRALFKVFSGQIALYAIPNMIMELGIRTVQPIALAYLIRYFTKSEMSKSEAFLYAGGVIFCSASYIFIVHPYMLAVFHIGMKIRIACCSLIYRKSLKLSRSALEETTVGQAVNLLSNDVNRFDSAAIFLHDLWVSPLVTIVVTYMMYQEVGVSALIGVSLMLIFIPLQGWLGKKSSTLRLRTAKRTDKRVNLTSEIVSGIQAIKMYAWEYPFSDLIKNIRKKETNVIRHASFLRGITMSFIMFLSRLALFITILSYVLSDNQLTAETVFMVAAYYGVLQSIMTIYIPQGITQMAEVLVTINRLEKFLMSDEIELVNDIRNGDCIMKEENATEIDNLKGKTDFGSLTFHNVCAKWLDSDDEDTLKGINLDIKSGQLVAIVGQVGSGKTSLLNAILKELPVHTGTVDVCGKIAYASQEPWLFAGSVRQNILFGRPWDAKKYDKVVKVCQLRRDFSLFPYGDKTIVGERGVSLSGGQRARINLARAVYSDAPLFLLDDPLSAVDAHVGKHMFEECIEKYLHGKTRILVTHQIQFLSNVEKIIVMKDGTIIAEGSYDKLVEMGVDFGRILESASENDEEKTLNKSNSHNNSRSTSISSLSSLKNNEIDHAEPEKVEETRSYQSIGGYVYSSYFKAGGNCCILLLIVLLFISSQFAASGGDFFIAFWVNLEQNNSKNFTFGQFSHAENSTSGLSENDRYICIYIFSALTVLTIVLSLVRSFAFFELCVTASKRLHDKMFRNISRATMRFFNTNPSGRILNRFSKDIGAIDELLPMAMIDCIQIGLSLVGIIVVVSIANVWLILPTFLVCVIFYILRVIYISTSRSVKRLEGITRSPVFNHLSATLHGLSTIRSFNAEEILIKEFDHHQDLHSSAWYIFIASSRSFGFWLDIFCLLYVTCVTMSFLILSDDDNNTYKGGDVGLAITQSIGLTGMFQWGMRQSAEVENQMTSVERVLEYTNIESEPALESLPSKKPKDDWPTRGKIEFKKVYLSYSPLEPPVLKNLNFTIEPREKIGVVGRTGAGKSSLISALFRLANIEGNIEIDGIDTAKIGLHDFRAKISIIPQEPFLFSGSLRKNLDPFEQYSDHILWSALEDVELKDMGLDEHINEGGSNLSVGQRQLVCLARAIVRNNKILVLDEATANVDPRTDEFIQKAIRRKFADCTVLTIAHRLNTVLDSDRILVMDAGSVVEFDHPHILFQKENGDLSNMVRETGEMMTEALKKIAHQNYNLHQQ
ncbi:probable multidrug resistance-associated protein lethal(2)03659 [Cotesia glomerata]|uniref:Multidrug resistance-associated protein lethal(2)03659 n=1 Tax=Cotesia glomerata TaxID=32391 RepID=A0AAV7I809_COTGL|nr:probable multidrug resistance-associated protein lethal(2)03659 [Cotesia glomerata]KAH0544123.1 hypothetical protein KQX54_000845 [Cotesia glomerata]